MSILGVVGAILGPSWELLRAILMPLVAFEGHLGAYGGASWSHLGALDGHVGATLIS